MHVHNETLYLFVEVTSSSSSFLPCVLEPVTHFSPLPPPPPPAVIVLSKFTACQLISRSFSSSLSSPIPIFVGCCCSGPLPSCLREGEKLCCCNRRWSTVLFHKMTHRQQNLTTNIKKSFKKLTHMLEMAGKKYIFTFKIVTKKFWAPVNVRDNSKC